MHPAIASNLPAIRDACIEHDVRALWLFGSAACDASSFDDARSDFDFIVDFGAHDLGPWGRHLFSLQRALQEILRRRVDLFTIEAIRDRSSFRQVDAAKVPIYAAA